MAKPDDDHVPTAIYGDDGELLAVAHMAPDASPEALEHMRAVVEAAKRMHEALPAEEREEMARRQAAAIERIRARARLRTTDNEETP